MIVGLVGITPAAGYANSYGALFIVALDVAAHDAAWPGAPIEASAPNPLPIATITRG